MKSVPLQLQPLDIEHIKQFYARAKKHEKLFRNILIDLSDNHIEAEYFRESNLEEIFEKYVKVTGYETRVSDFRVGSFEKKGNLLYTYKFHSFDTTKIKKNIATILIEKTNDSWLNKYLILENFDIKREGTIFYRQY